MEILEPPLQESRVRSKAKQQLQALSSPVVPEAPPSPDVAFFTTPCPKLLGLGTAPKVCNGFTEVQTPIPSACKPPHPIHPKPWSIPTQSPHPFSSPSLGNPQSPTFLNRLRLLTLGILDLQL